MGRQKLDDLVLAQRRRAGATLFGVLRACDVYQKSLATNLGMSKGYLGEILAGNRPFPNRKRCVESILPYLRDEDSNQALTVALANSLLGSAGYALLAHHESTKLHLLAASQNTPDEQLLESSATQRAPITVGEESLKRSGVQPRSLRIPGRHNPEGEQSSFIDVPTYKRYIARFRAKLQRQNVDPYVSLGLAAVKQEEYRQLMARGKGESETIEQVAAKYETGTIAITGEPGCGKTTLLARLALSKSDGKVPVFVPFGLYRKGTDFLTLLDLAEFPMEVVKHSLDNGLMSIVFDGVNEAQSDDLDEVFSDLLSFIKQWPKNQYFLSCRTADFPPWLQSFVEDYAILPLRREQIELQFLAVLGDDIGSKRFEEVFMGQRSAHLRALCHNPLLLRMILALFERDKELSVRTLQSRSALYDTFLEDLDSRESAKRPPTDVDKLVPSSLRQEALELIGFEMERRELVYVSAREIESWLALLANSGSWASRFLNPPLTVQTLVRHVAGRPPIKAIDLERSSRRRLGFLHQSFGEFYAASYLKSVIEDAGYEFTCLSELSLETSRRHWEVASFLCGLLHSNTALLLYLKQEALKGANQSLLVLAGRCVRDNPGIPSREVDDLILRIIDAFKNWSIPFDYDLILTICELLDSGVNSSSFPARLIEDVEWWRNKYANVFPMELSLSPTDLLLRYMQSGDMATTIDAVYTLGKRVYELDSERARVINTLITCFSGSKGELREQILVAFKDLKAVEAKSILLGIIDDSQESGRARAYALNALGSIGDLDAAWPMMHYLLNHDNPFRDSASWSLQLLGLKAQQVQPDLAAEIRRIYWQALISETNDMEGRYAKGNILYSLGMLKASEYREDLIEWVRKNLDPYVIEDAIQALGAIGGESADDLVIGFLSNDDPGVRMKAAQAVGRMGLRRAQPLLERLLFDSYSVVRETAERALASLGPEAESEREKFHE